MERSGVIKVAGGWLAAGLRMLAVLAPLSLVCLACGNLPAGEMIGQWVWFDRLAVLSAVCVLCSFLFCTGRCPLQVSSAVAWALMTWGTVEAFIGLRQLYGFASSNHSMYALTGSFFNPGPYSGYLAMVLPVCLHQWLVGRRGDRIVDKAGYVVSGGAMLLILCVLPAGMSRSAWLAAGVSCLCVYAWHMGWAGKFRSLWRRQRRRVVMAMAGGGCALLLAGYLMFALKPDSARGRLLMWKMTCRAIAEKPWTGYGAHGFAAAYGDAQEAYFAAGEYEPWEERVAGSPEYAFNEYLQVAVERGVPWAACLLAAVMLCLYIGVRKGRYGICGAILSLMVFSFSSYPLQLPAFIVAFVGLLLACVLDGNRWQWLGLAVLTGVVGGIRLKDDLRTERACREWMNARVLYQAGAYQAAEKAYGRLYPLLENRAAFLFEYGHGLHKQQKFASSNDVLEEALRHSSDPMILNVMGKNHQQMGDCQAAEKCFIRSAHRLPGRIYPYYLLAKLYVGPDFRQPEKFEEMRRMVLTKEPKVNSTAIRQMREEVEKMQLTPF